MPNPVAYLALSIWPICAIWLFRTQPIARAAVISVLLSFLFLPEETAFELALVPPLDKETIPSLVFLMLMFALARDRLKVVPPDLVSTLLIATMFAGALLTIASNRDLLSYGTDRVLPPQRLYDGLSYSALLFLKLIPFFVGASLLGSRAGHRLFLKALFLAGFGYAFLMLVEIRLSPQLHNWIYGFYPHMFGQSIRAGGFRPSVFLIHGLWTTYFLMTATVAGCVLLRQSAREDRLPWVLACAFLFGVLAISKSLGALFVGCVLVPAVLILSPAWQIRLAAGFAVLALAYPVLRATELFPVDQVLALAGQISEHRAGSLGYRFDNEDLLLAHANQRPWFGWGLWGRNRVYDSFTGDDLTITDGFWIITAGTFGWVGFAAIFGFLAWPLFRAVRHAHRIDRATAGLGLIHGASMVELLPNSYFPPWTWLIVGALLAQRCRRTPEEEDAALFAEVPTPPRLSTLL